MKNQRPVNLDLTKFHFPITAILSILHRISGVVLFLFSPYLLYLLQETIASQSRFEDLAAHLNQPVMKIGVWVFLGALSLHVVAGLRHLMMDMGLGESLQTARASSRWTLVIFVVLLILAGVWLW